MPEVRVTYNFTTEGHRPEGGSDLNFYRELPNRTERHVGALGKPQIPRKSVEQVLTTIGTAALSSTALAAIIKSYLARSRTKVKISITGKSKTIVYEGPNLKEDLPVIEQAIGSLCEQCDGESLHIAAQHSPIPNQEA